MTFPRWPTFEVCPVIADGMKPSLENIVFCVAEGKDLISKIVYKFAGKLPEFFTTGNLARTSKESRFADLHFGFVIG